MEWIDVKENHFVDLEVYDTDYQWTGRVDGPFMVAVPTNNGYEIQQVILVDEVGLQCYGDDGPSYYGWQITDVTHWFEPTNPSIDK